MAGWLVFTAAVLFITVTGWMFWNDIAEWFDQAQHEALLDELWADDDDLAESA